MHLQTAGCRCGARRVQERGSVEAGSSRTAPALGSRGYIRSRVDAAIENRCPVRVARVNRSAIKASLALVEARQQNGTVVERPNTIIDLLEADRFAVQSVAQEQP